MVYYPSTDQHLFQSLEVLFSHHILLSPCSRPRRMLEIAQLTPIARFLNYCLQQNDPCLLHITCHPIHSVSQRPLWMNNLHVRHHLNEGRARSSSVFRQMYLLLGLFHTDSVYPKLHLLVVWALPVFLEYINRSLLYFVVFFWYVRYIDSAA